MKTAMFKHSASSFTISEKNIEHNKIEYIHLGKLMLGSRKIFQRVSKFFLNGVSPAGPWWPNIECWLGSFVIFQGIRTSIAKKPYIFVIFQGGGGQDGLSHPLDPPMKLVIIVEKTMNCLGEGYHGVTNVLLKQVSR